MISKDTLKLIGQFIVAVILFSTSFLLIKENKVVGYISLVFWGAVLLFFLIAVLPSSLLNWIKSYMRFLAKGKYIDNADPPKIKIEQVEPIDDEVEEEWFRVCNDEYKQFHGVSAIKVNEEKFSWSVYFSAGEFIREKTFSTELYKIIYEALLATPGVTEAYHEDTEKFVLEGHPNGEDLVKSVSKTIDKFMVRFYESHSKE